MNICNICNIYILTDQEDIQDYFNMFTIVTFANNECLLATDAWNHWRSAIQTETYTQHIKMKNKI